MVNLRGGRHTEILSRTKVMFYFGVSPSPIADIYNANIKNHAIFPDDPHRVEYQVDIYIRTISFLTK